MTQGAPSESRALSRVQAWSVAVIATLTMAVSYVDRQALAAMAPRVTHDLHISDPMYGWLQSAFSAAYLVGAPLAGRWIDRAGARRGLPIAMLVWSLVAAAHAVAPGFAVLVAMRVALGLAESPSFPGAAQTIQRVLPPRERSAGFGLLFTGSSVGAAIAPPLAIALMGAWGWRTAFAGTAIAGLLWIPLWFGVTRSQGVPALLDARVATARDEPRVSLVALLMHRGVMRAVIVVLATAPVIAFTLLWLSKFLFATHRVPQRDLGVYLWLPPVCFDVGSLLFGGLASRTESRYGLRDRPHRTLFAVALLFACGLAAMPFVIGPWNAVLFAGSASFGGGAMYALITADMLARVRPDAVSAAGGLTAAAQSLAYIVANPLIGIVVQRTHSYRAVLVGLALWVLPGSIAWLLWKPPARHASERR